MMNAKIALSNGNGGGSSSATAKLIPSLFQPENDDGCNEDKEEQKQRKWSEEDDLSTYIK